MSGPQRIGQRVDAPMQRQEPLVVGLGRLGVPDTVRGLRLV